MAILGSFSNSCILSVVMLLVDVSMQEDVS